MLDQHSPAVVKITTEMRSEIDRLHGTLERIGKDPTDYDIARGQIKALRWTLKLIEGEPDSEAIDG